MARSNDVNVRIGPISLFTFIAVICLAVLAVLTATTANATSVLSQRQAESTTSEYLAESAAQTFLGYVDNAILLSGDPTAAGAAASVSAQLPNLVQKAREVAPNAITVDANVQGNAVVAKFVCENRRTLNITVVIGDNMTYAIASWKMSAVENAAKPDDLWTGQAG